MSFVSDRCKVSRSLRRSGGRWMEVVNGEVGWRHAAACEVGQSLTSFPGMIQMASTYM